MNILKKISFDFGEVVFYRNSKSKYLRIRIHPEKGIMVSVPDLCSEEKAVSFVQQKENWIKKSLSKTVNLKNKTTLFTEKLHFQTKYHSLVIEKHNRPALRCEVKNRMIKIFYPEFAVISDDKIQNFIRKTIIETLRLEAKFYLPKRTRELADKHNFNINEVKVRNNKTRWGSCSGTNNINLNIHLMRLDDKLIDYVIFHELVHTKIKNHSTKYWQTLENYLTGAKLLDKELNKYNLNYW